MDDMRVLKYNKKHKSIHFTNFWSNSFFLTQTDTHMVLNFNISSRLAFHSKFQLSISIHPALEIIPNWNKMTHEAAHR